MRNHGVRTKLWLGDNLCCPSRTTMLTGRTAYNTGILDNDRYAQLGKQSLPVWMRDAGYCTAFAGRYVNHYQPNRTRPPGWRFWEPLAGSFDDETGYAIVGRDGLAAAGHVHHRPPREGGPRAAAGLPGTGRAGVRRPVDVRAALGSTRGRYSAVPVPWANSDPSFHEADLSDKPAWLQDHPPLRGAAYYEDQFAHRVRTLLSVDNVLGELIVDRPSATSSTAPCSSSRATTGGCSASTG